MKYALAALVVFGLLAVGCGGGGDEPREQVAQISEQPTQVASPCRIPAEFEARIRTAIENGKAWNAYASKTGNRPVPDLIGKDIGVAVTTLFDEDNRESTVTFTVLRSAQPLRSEFVNVSATCGRAIKALIAQPS